MKTNILTGTAFMFAAITTAHAASAEPLSGISYGLTFASDYVSKGQTQTDGKPNIQGYVEFGLFDDFYAGVNLTNVSFPSTPWGLSDPSLEVDVFAGVRKAWGAASLDAGAVYYYYPGELKVNELAPGSPVSNFDMWEFYAIPGYKISDTLDIGATVYVTPDFSGTGAKGGYLSGTFKSALPGLAPNSGWTFDVSGEFGRQWLGDTDFRNAAAGDYNIPDFFAWNVGVSAGKDSVTLDLRYHDSDLSEGVGGECAMVSGITDACGARIVASVSIMGSLFSGN